MKRITLSLLPWILATCAAGALLQRPAKLVWALADGSISDSVARPLGGSPATDEPLLLSAVR